MRVAEVLSDLTSLRACDQTAALALVSVRSTTSEEEETEDKDLQRAKDLIKLHYSMKVPHENGKVDASLLEARKSIRFRRRRFMTKTVTYHQNAYGAATLPLVALVQDGTHGCHDA